MTDQESTVQSQLADILNRRLSSPGTVRPVRQENARQSVEGQTTQMGTASQSGQLIRCPQGSGSGQSVHQEMARSFPGLFRREAKGKRRFAPDARLQKGFLVNFFLLDRQRSKTPKGDEELQLILAGLGKRSLTVNESFRHSEVFLFKLTDSLLNAFPRLSSINGGWLLHNSTGGGGQRKLVVIPPDSDGYSGQQLKAVSGNGKCTLYIAPLQEEIDTTPFPPEAKEFENMPKAPCTTCKKMVPLQALPFHIKSCIDESIDLDSSPESESCNPDHMPPLSTESQTKMTAECPVCRDVFDIDTIETHASDWNMLFRQRRQCWHFKCTNPFFSKLR
ncbi:uncharacterized protein LOC124874269 isoform X2 [Girardinichthys multiradiatus]|uniref:uncharacterized protein LOC124874269 isoform X2 n=1 Tax=Girardinichthys multiradiatus TaxID=208333 RepID=UPI001FAE1478|nr:uncharacterized protein LOC124874269 isoform X2 [Girardinichthys multiradiatus]